MDNNQKLAELFRKKSYWEKNRTDYADWIYWLHTYVPWFFFCWYCAISYFFNFPRKVDVNVFLVTINVYFIFSWLWWKKLQVYSKNIAKIDKKIAEELIKFKS